MTLKFSDGIDVDTSGHVRILCLHDGWYVVGGGFLIPFKSENEAKIWLNKYSPPDKKDRD